MRDRLIELLEAVYKNPKVRCPRSDELTCDGCKYDLGDQCDISAIIADHLLAEGVIVPPCKVGDEVYCIWQYVLGEVGVPFVKKTKAAYFFFDNGIVKVVPEGYDEMRNYWYRLLDIAFTKEEAEKALAERSEG